MSFTMRRIRLPRCQHVRSFTTHKPIIGEWTPKGNWGPKQIVQSSYDQSQSDEQINSAFNQSSHTINQIPEPVTPGADVLSFGRVSGVSGDVINVSGCETASLGSLVWLKQINDVPLPGVVVAVERDCIDVAIIAESNQSINVSINSVVVHEKNGVPTFPCDSKIEGRVLNPMGIALDKGPTLSSTLPRNQSLNPPAMRLNDRGSPTQFISSGYKHIDFFHPLMKGLRVGLFGHRQTGKSTLAVNILIHLCSTYNMHGVIVLIGRKQPDVDQIKARLTEAGVIERVTIVYASDVSSTGNLYLAPFSGCTIADWHRDQGRDCVIIYDDLVTHGSVLHAIDRALGFPAVSASYVHARLLERTASRDNTPGSSTALVVLEHPQPDRAVAVIESLVGFVDHCIHLDPNMAAKKIWPAINAGSIIGRPSAMFRSRLLRSISHSMSQLVLQSERTAHRHAWAKEFGLEPEDEETAILGYRDKLQALLSQPKPLHIKLQIISLLAANHPSLLEAIAKKDMRLFELSLHAHVLQKHKETMKELEAACATPRNELSNELRQKLDKIVDEFIQEWQREHGFDEDEDQ